MRKMIILLLLAVLLPFGTTANAALTDNGNGTVTDSRTGLIWQQGEPGAKVWGSALSYCEGLDLGGSTSWRLPNYKELESLTDDTRYNPSIDTSKFPNAVASDYWSSTTYADYQGVAWGVDFGNGYVTADYKGDTFYVRCVRGGQSGSFGNLAISPSMGDFGAIQPGVESYPQVFTVANTGSTNLTITSTTTTGTNSGDFLIRNNYCAGAILTPSGSCSLEVVFAPLGYGARAATLTVKAGTAAAAIATLTGTGVYDTDPPSVAISAPSATVTKAGPVTYTVTYADANFNESTLAVGNVTLNKTGTANGTVGVTGTGAARTVTISNVTGDGTLGISIAAGTATDLAGNSAPAAGPSATFQADNTAPTVVSATSTTADGQYKAGAAINVTVNFSEAVTSTGLTIAMNSGASLTTGALAGVTSYSGVTTVTAGQNSADLSISTITGTITDAATNASVNPTVPAGQNVGDAKAIVIDTTAPTVVIGAPSAAVTKAGPVTYTVTYADTNFNASILAAGAITLNKTGTANGTVGVTGTGTTRTVTISSVTGDGTLGISIAAGTATDLAGNSAPAAGPSATFQADNTAPTVTGATSTTADGQYKAGAAINVAVNFSEAVTSTGGLTINLNSGASLTTGALAGVMSFSGTYTVGAGQNSADLSISTIIGTITDAATNASVNQSGSLTTGELSGVTSYSGTYTVGAVHNSADLSTSTITGTITDAATNATVNPTVPAGQNIADAKAIVIDTTDPAVTIGAPSATLTRVGPVMYTVTYADVNFKASTLAVGNVTLNKTGTANGTVAVGGTGTARTVTISGVTGDGTLGITLAAGTATDLAGNGAPAGGPSTTFIVDNTLPTLTIAATVPSTPEAGPTAGQFTVTRAGSQNFALTAKFVVAGTATAGSDYTSLGTSVTIPAGAASATITVTPVNDTLDESDETVIATLSADAAYTVGSPSTATVTISDDDPTPTVQFSQAASSGLESATPATFLVTLSAASGQTVKVNYSTSNGTAVAGTAGNNDYTSTSGLLTFNPGVTSQTISVAIADDAVVELNETFTVDLLGPQNAIPGTPVTHTYTINDNDSPTVQFAVASSSGLETTTPATIAVNLSAASGRTITVNYATADGTATAGSDYMATSGMLTFNPGVTSQSIAVPITSDTTQDPDETFTVTLTVPVNAALGAIATHTRSIYDDNVPGVAGLKAIAEAVDQPTWTFTTTVGANWWLQSAVTHDGIDAARSGFIADNHASSFQTTGSFGAGTVSFWWKVSSEPGADVLRFSIDGVVKYTISGEVGWRQQSYTVTAGSHTLKWEYAKNANGAGGIDAGWVDQLVVPSAPVLWTPRGTGQAVQEKVNQGSQPDTPPGNGWAYPSKRHADE